MKGHVLGIDPGLAAIGLALLECEKQPLVHALTLKGDFSGLRGEAIAVIDEGIKDILSQASGSGRIDVAMEDYSVFGFSGAIIRAAEMGEVIRYFIEHLVRTEKIPRDRVFRYRSTEVRDFICGNRRAKDAQVRECLEELGYTQRMNPHTRDALAVALFHICEEEAERRGRK